MTSGNSFSVTARFLADISSYLRGQTEMTRANARTAASIKQMQTAVDQVSAAADEFSESLRKVAEASRKANDHTGKLTGTLRGHKQAAEQAASGNETLTTSTNKVSDAMARMSTAVADAHARLGTRSGGKFAQGTAAEADKATSSLKVFAVAAGAAGAAYLTLSKTARANALSGLTSGLARASSELRDLPGLFNKIGAGYDLLHKKGATLFDKVGSNVSVAHAKFGTFADVSARVVKTLHAGVAPVVKQQGAWKALSMAVGATYAAVGLAGRGYSKFGGLVNAASGGLAQTAMNLHSGNAGIDDYFKAQEQFQQQNRRFQVAKDRAARRAEKNGTGGGEMRFAADAAKEVVATNLLAAGIGRLKNSIVGIGRGTNELGQSLGVIDRARNSYARLFDVTGGIVLAQTFSRVTKATMGFVQSTVMAGARSKELDVVLKQLGTSAGYSNANLQKQVAGLKEAGIEGKAAKSALADFIKVGIPVDQAEKLAKVARDFAVLSGSDTSDTFQRIVYGLASRQTEVLRTAGVQMTFEQGFATYAKSLGKSVSDLTEVEKTQAGVNEVLKAGVKVSGAYETAMGTASKQLRSTKRYIEEIRTALGTALEPAFAKAVKVVGDFIKPGSKIAEMAKSTGILGRAFTEMGKIGERVFDNMYKRVERALKAFDPAELMAKIKGMMSQSSSTVGALLPAGLGALGGILAKATPILGGYLQSIKVWQFGLAALVLSNKELRDAVGGLLVQLGKAAVIVAAYLTPAVKILSDFLESNSATIADLAEQVGKLAVDMAKMAAAAAIAAAGPLKLLLNILGQIMKLLNATGGVYWVTALIVGFKAFDKFHDATRKVVALTMAMKQLHSIAGVVSRVGPRWAATAVNRASDTAKEGAAARAAAASFARGGGDALVPVGQLALMKQNEAVVKQGTKAMSGLTAETAAATKQAGRLGSTMSSGMSAVKTGAIAGGNAMKTLVAGMGAANVAALAMTAVMIGIGVLFAAHQRNLAKQSEELGKMAHLQSSVYDMTAKTSGRKKALSDLSSDYGRLTASIEQQAEAIAKVDKTTVFGAKQRAKYVNADFWGRSMMKLSGAADAKEAPKGAWGAIKQFWNAPMASPWANGPKNSQEAQLAATTKQLEAFKKAFKEDIKPKLFEQADEELSRLDGNLKASKATLEDVQASLQASLRLAANGLENFDAKSFTQQQMLAFENFTNELSDSVTGWQQKLTSFGTAMSREAVIDVPSIEKHFREARARVEWFWNDIGRLMELGVPKDALMEFISAGPEQAGDELAKWRKTFDEAGEAGVKSMVANMQGAIGAIKTANQEAIQAIAQEWLNSGEMSKVDSPEIARELAKEAAAVKREILSGVESAQIFSGSLDQIVAMGDQKNKPELQAQVDAYQSAVDQTLAVITSGTATAQQRMAAFTQATSLAQALQNSEDPALAEMAQKIQAIIQTVLENYPQLAGLSSQLGANMGEGLALNFGNNAVTGVNGALNQIGQNVGAAATRWGSALQAAIPKFEGRSDPQAGLVRRIVANIPSQTKSTKTTESSNSVAQSKLPEVTLARPGNGSLGGTSWNPGSGGGGGQDIAQQVRDANPPVKLLAEALDNLIGNLRAFERALDSTNNYVEDYAKSLVRLGYSTDDVSRKKRDLGRLTDGLIEQLKAETEAAVKSGKVQNDAASVSKYFKDRLGELKDQIPGLVKEFQTGTKSIDDLREAVSLAQKTLDDGLFIKIDLDEASFGKEEALDKLDQRVKDQRNLLTGVNLSAKDKRAIYRDTTKDLIGYVRALQGAAKAEALAGKIGADAASQQKYIRDGLTKAKELYPELGEKIDEYIATLTAIDKAVPGDQTVDVLVNAQVAKAMSDIELFQGALSGIEREIEVVITAKIAEAMAASGGGGGGGVEPIPNIGDLGQAERAAGLADGPIPATGIVQPSVAGAARGVAKAGIAKAGEIAALAKAAGSSATAFQQLVRKVNEEATAKANSGRIGKDWTSIQADVERQLKDAAEQYPDLKDKVDDYTKAVKDIPKDAVTVAEADTEGAAAAVGAYRSYIDRTIPAETMTTMDATIPAYEQVGEFGAMVDGVTGVKTTEIQLAGAETFKRAVRAAIEHVLYLNSVILDPKDISGTYLRLHDGMDADLAGADLGGPLKPGKTLVLNQTGQTEWVLNPKQMDLLRAATGQHSIPAAITALARMAGDTSAEVNLPEVLRPVGEQVAPGMTGSGTEPQTGGFGMNAFLDRLESVLAANGGTTVENLNVQSSSDPQSWLNEAMWRAVRGTY